MAQSFQHQFFDFLLQSQYFSASDMRAQQLHQLEQLVRFSRERVPFYKNRLNCLFTNQDKFDFEQWHNVPILSRQDLLDHRESMLAPALPPHHGGVAHHEGSGTTGKTVTTAHNQLIAEVSNAAYYRALSWHGFDYSKNLFSWFGGSPDEDRWPHGSKEFMWGPKWDARSTVGKMRTLSRLDSVEHAYEFMTLHRPSYATGRPNAMLELAQETERRGSKIKLDSIISFSAQLTETTREECYRVFGATILNRYASKEVYDIAHQCPAGNHLHVAAEAMIFEVLDDNDRPCPPGVPGRVIVTPFYGTAQPMIRYDQGDVVTLGEPCQCGRNLPVISELNGRTIHLFRRPDGTRFSLRIPDTLRKTIGGLEWQVAQTGFEAVEIRYLKRADAPQAAFDQVTNLIKSQMTPSTQVLYTAVKKLPETRSGKILELVCEVPEQ